MKMTAQIQVYLSNQRGKKLNLLDEKVSIFIKLPKGNYFLIYNRFLLQRLLKDLVFMFPTVFY